MTDSFDKAQPASDKPEASRRPQRKESFFANILLNIIIPVLILSKLSGDQHLGPTWALVVALAFPLGYGAREFLITRKLNVFSALGFISVLLTGGISLLKLDPAYIAIKEAAIPGIIGIATLLSLKTRFPLVKTFLYNDKVLKIHKVAAALQQYNNEPRFEKVLRNASYLVASSFFLSSVLNYALAKYFLVSPPGTEAFNAELGKMTAWSYPIIAVPAMLVMIASMFYLFRQIRLLTHLTLEEIINDGSDDE